MPFILPDLPYDRAAFGATLSAQTFDFHHGKHHKAYVDKANNLLAEVDELRGASLLTVIAAAHQTGNAALFNNSAQIWNHSFYWLGLTPEPQQPTGRLADMIVNGFGSTDGLVSALTREALAHFGSGWGWLVLDQGKLKVTSLHDADTPAVHGMTPLLTLDVWEHAYYIDYRSARADYLTTLLGRAINWEFVAENLDGGGLARADQQG